MQLARFGCLEAQHTSTGLNVDFLLVWCRLQYLKFEEFEDTVHSFDKECKSKGKLVSKPQGSTFRDSKTRVIEVRIQVSCMLVDYL